MYAIIKTGGKQYTVKPGDVLRIERLEAELGAELKLDDVLMIGGDKTFVGDKVAKSVVTVVVTDQERGPKVIVFKKKRRQGYRRMGGHRQPYTEIFVTSITNPDGQTEKADGKPQVYNPERKAEKLAKGEEIRLMKNEAARKAAKAEGAAAPAPKKKAAPKKAAGKTGAKKKTTKKPAAKKAAKKTTKK